MRILNERFFATSVSILLSCLALSACSGGGDNEILEVLIKLDGVTPKLSRANILVDYSKTGARPVVVDGKPACTFLLPHLGGSFLDDGNGRLTLRALSDRGFSGPGAIAACRMTADFTEATAATISKKLQVSLVTALGVDGNDIDSASLAGGRGDSHAMRQSRRTGETSTRSGAAAGGGPEGSALAPGLRQRQSAAAKALAAKQRKLQETTRDATATGSKLPAAAAPRDQASAVPTPSAQAPAAQATGPSQTARAASSNRAAALQAAALQAAAEQAAAEQAYQAPAEDEPDEEPPYDDSPTFTPGAPEY